MAADHVHPPLVAGIYGRKGDGARSVVLAGEFADEDHGDHLWVIPQECLLSMISVNLAIVFILEVAAESLGCVCSIGTPAWSQRLILYLGSFWSSDL
jgi:hypothetical protein